jgi:hypothetical protein
MFPSSCCALWLFVIANSLLILSVGGFRASDGDKYNADTSRDDMQSVDQGILVPDIDFSHEKWFDAGKALEELRLSQVRTNALLRASLEPDRTQTEELQRKVDADTERLNDDFQTVHTLAAEIAADNRKVQSFPVFRSPHQAVDDFGAYSFLQLGENNATIEDWGYCACETGPNGTLVLKDRNWPDASFFATVPPAPVVNLTAQPSAMLQISLNGRRLGLRESDACNCTNPWVSFDNTSNMCKLINSVTVCLVHVSSKPAEKVSDIATQARALLNAIDSSVATPSFMEIWSPFRFQL